MSSFDVILRSDSASIVGDGAGIDADGRINFMSSKIWSLAHIPAVIAFRGPSTAGSFLAPILGSNAATFDKLKEIAGRTLRSAVAELRPLFAGAPLADNIDCVVAGWSESRGPDAFIVTAYGGYGAPAWTPIPLGPGVTSVPGDPSIFAALDLPEGANSDDVDPQRDGLKMLEAKRAQYGRYFVGVFGEIATVHADRIETKIITRWPEDVVGTKLGTIPEAT